jgi:hypothetical protein
MAFFQCSDGSIYYTAFVRRARQRRAGIVNELRPWSRRIFLATYRVGIFSWVMILCLFTVGLMLRIPSLTGDQGVFALGGADAVVLVVVSIITNIGFRGRRKDISSARVDVSLSKLFYFFYFLSMVGSALILFPVIYEAVVAGQAFAARVFVGLVVLLFAAAVFYAFRITMLAKL